MNRMLIKTALMVAAITWFAYAANSVVTICGTGTSSTSAHITVTASGENKAYLCPDEFVVESGASLTTWDPGAICSATTSGEGDISLPVILTSFTAIAGDREINIRWITESEIENIGFNIYRSANSNVKFLIINDELIPGAGNSSQRHEYEYVDNGLTNGVTYWYKLEDVDYSGNTELHGPVSSTPMKKAAPREFRLYPNYPNPFNPFTTISYDLPEEGYVELTVYNMRGEKVTTLMQGNQEAGSYRLNWDGTSQSGDMVSSGIYFLRIVSGSYSRTSKMVFIR